MYELKWQAGPVIEYEHCIYSNGTIDYYTIYTIQYIKTILFNILTSTY